MRKPGEIPTDWKLPDVSPSYKKGIKEDVKNYRAVSLNSVRRKIIEIVLGAVQKGV